MWRCTGWPGNDDGPWRSGSTPAEPLASWSRSRPDDHLPREARVILALELFRSVPRYVAARAVGSRQPGLLAGPLAPLRLVHREDPEPRGEGWGRVRPRLAGICGSDLATVSGRSSFYFSPLVSMPFVPGHEGVGGLADDVEDL